METDSSSLQADLVNIRSKPVVAPKPGRTVFRAFGPDAARYLHIRLTQAVRPLRPGEGSYAFMLNPQGKLQGELTILCRDQGKEPSFTLLSDSTPGSDREELRKAILQFKVADAVEIEDLTEQFSSAIIVASSDEQADAVLASLGTAAGDPRRLVPPAFITFQEQQTDRGTRFAARGTARSFTVIEIASTGYSSSADLAADLVRTTGAVAVSRESIEVFRILCRLPAAGTEITEKVIAPELPIEHHVAFNKGCYTGQEVVEMATTRGRPNRKLIRLFSEGPSAPAAGDEVLFNSGELAGKSCGIITSAIQVNDASSVLLALVKITVPGEEILRSGECLLRPYPLPSVTPLDDLLGAVDSIPLG